MTYQAIDQLTQDVVFGGRMRAACVEQAQTFRDDQRPSYVAVAGACLIGDGTIYNAFTRLAAGGPGIGDKVTMPEGKIDQARVSDADILALTQAAWPAVALLYYDDDGTRRPNR